MTKDGIYLNMVKYIHGWNYTANEDDILHVFVF